jgi:putative endonuclease
MAITGLSERSRGHVASPKAPDRTRSSAPLGQNGDERRTQRRQSGDAAEQLVVEHLERTGYVIAARNVHCRAGELDIVAEKGLVLAFVEVRMRSTAVWGDPSMTVTNSKQRKVVMSAYEYCQRHRLFQRVIRFDVASVVGRGREMQVEYIEDAFDAGM